jgi:transposase
MIFYQNSVATMHLDFASKTVSGKTYQRVLLRTSFRVGKKTKHRTIANLSSCSKEEIEAIRLALKRKKDLSQLSAEIDSRQPDEQGPNVGAVYALKEIAKKTGLLSCLGQSRQGQLALWQVFARMIGQGSRLSAVRLARQHAVCDILKLDDFHEDDLYYNLEWLANHQAAIEKKLFYKKNCKKESLLFLYDVTSSYLEGKQNEFGNYGYNRDKKKGKKQIVIGLLTDAEGDPVSVQVFHGNTSDSSTFLDQVHKVCERFEVKHMTFVGDRGVIKGPQIKDISEIEGIKCHFVTAITKTQITTMLKENRIKLDQFSEHVFEFEENGLRYLLRRNPVRQKELMDNRELKFKTVQEMVNNENQYLNKHSKALVDTSFRKVSEKAKKLLISKWVKICIIGRTLSLEKNEPVLNQEALLDGCYVIKTDLPASSEANALAVHDRYKDLAQVEFAFKTMKTVHLEMRPHYVRKEYSTEGHVFVVMLAYKLVRYLKMAWEKFNITVCEGIAELGSICAMKREALKDIYLVPKPRELARQLLDAIDVILPEVLLTKGIVVATRKKLKMST